jgi:hypothetical protein
VWLSKLRNIKSIIAKSFARRVVLRLGITAGIRQIIGPVKTPSLNYEKIAHRYPLLPHFCADFVRPNATAAAGCDCACGNCARNNDD